eukprot:sb/3461431/
MDVYNIQIDHLNTGELLNCFKKVYRHQRNAFKLQISLGVILKHRRTGEFAYYCPSQNNQLLLDAPTLVKNSDDKRAFINLLEGIDLEKSIRRPSTEWSAVKVTNVSFYVYRLKGTAIGSGVELPDYLLRNKGLVSLVTSRKTGKPYSDQKCFFRCLALHQGSDPQSLEKKTNQLVKEYCKMASIKIKQFNGVSLDQLEDVSRLFGVGIVVYEQDEDRSTSTVWRSITEDNVLHVNLFQTHFSFVQDLEKFSSSYRCIQCNKFFDHHGTYKRHMKTCDMNVRQKYVGGTFSVKPTVFDELEDFGVDIPSELRPYPYRAVFDIECMLTKEVDIAETDRTSYVNRHQLISISVCSNVPEFQTPRCFVLNTPDGQNTLVSEFLEYLRKISDVAACKVRELYQEYNIADVEDEKLQSRWENHVSQLPVLAFNGAKYDLNVLREFLFPILAKEDSVRFMIKKGSSYMAICTDQLKFLDMINYVAPGYSLDKFTKAYGAKDRKSFFPYEYLDCFDKLKVKKFPEYQDFFSSLKGKVLLEPNVGENLSDLEVQHIGRRPSKDNPISLKEIGELGQFRYDQLKDMFQRNEWCVRDYLIFYNNLDTTSFLEAIENLVQYYNARGVDVFKDALSVPGIAERIAFKGLNNRDETFHLFNGKNKDLVHLFLSNNVGGPAIIFDRYAEAGATTIRHKMDGKLCKKVVGFDANALYLECMSSEMPCGMFLRRRAPDFILEYPTYTSKVAIQWLSWVEEDQGIEIQHAKNSGTNTGASKFIAVEPYFQLVEMWECHWKEKRKSVKLSTKHRYPFEASYRLTEKQILAAIQNGEIFGAAEVDINVPDNLKDRYEKFSSQLEYFRFSEMTPIFKNVVITEGDIGEYMRDYIRETGEKFKDRRNLIGSMFAEKILLITPLLKWYLDNGLVVTKLHQFVQFRPVRCFKSFADNVSNDRRAGDADPSKAIIAETSKLIGNSVYGHSIMRKDRHTSVKLVDLEKASKLVNDPLMVSLEEMEDETFEVVSKKRRVTYDLPVHLGFFVYSLAKLKMLKFYYDVLDRFIDRSNFALLEMDTGENYIGTYHRRRLSAAESRLRRKN